MRVMLQHKLSLPLPSVNPNVSFFNVDCPAGVVEDHIFQCPGGEVVTISCNGSLMRGRQFCPMKLSSVGCQTKVQSSSTTAEISCKLSDHNESMTVCLCDLSKIGDIGGKVGSVSFSIFSIERSVLRVCVDLGDINFSVKWGCVWELGGVGDLRRSWRVVCVDYGVGDLFRCL
jgi:hypothetical protein